MVEPPEKFAVPVLVLNGEADVASRKIERLLETIQTARSSVCEGDHYSAPFYPTFQQTIIGFFEGQWRRRGIESRSPASQTAKG